MQAINRVHKKENSAQMVNFDACVFCKNKIWDTN